MTLPHSPFPPPNPPPHSSLLLAQLTVAPSRSQVGRVALEVHFDAELLRSRLHSLDFAYEAPPIGELEWPRLLVQRRTLVPPLHS